ncbi:TPA: hypothetical protein ACX6S2_003439 [Photobacterium damselae]
MNNIFQMSQELKKQIDWINEIILGGAKDEVLINGIKKPSITKAIDDNFSYLQSLVKGRPSFEKYNDLIKYIPTGNIKLAEVWNDIGEKNGLYGWSIDTWVKSPYDTYSTLKSDINKLESKTNNLDLMFGGTPIVVTENGLVPVGLDDDGNLVIAGLVMSQLSLSNNRSSASPLAIIDEHGQVVVGINGDGQVVINSLQIDKLLSNSGESVAVIKNDYLHLSKLSFDNVSEIDQVIPGILWGISDDEGKVSIHLDNHGNFVCGNGFKCDGLSVYKDINSLKMAIVDEDDNVVLGVNEKGELIGRIAEDSPKIKLKPQTEPRKKLSLNHIMMHGQSLSVATAGNVNDVTDGDLTFSLGHNITINDKNNNLSPISTNGPSGVQYVAIQQMKWLIRHDPEYFNDYRILSSAFGVSGASIEGISKGTSAWNNGLWQVKEGERLSDASDVSYQVQALGWIQGESNRKDTHDEYLAKLVKMHDDFYIDVAEITGQLWKPLMYVYQLDSEQFWEEGVDLEPSVASALLTASNTIDSIKMVSPTYFIDHRDGVHFNDKGYAHYGQMWGKVLYRSLYRGEEWNPLQPVNSYIINKNKIVIEFNVPEPPLVFDNVTVTDPGNYGFRVRCNSRDLGIRNVSIINGTTVCISCIDDVPIDSEVSYAWYANGGQLGGPESGPRGCLKDSDSTPSCYGVPLNNWCVRFKIKIGE